MKIKGLHLIKNKRLRRAIEKIQEEFKEHLIIRICETQKQSINKKCIKKYKFTVSGLFFAHPNFSKKSKYGYGKTVIEIYLNNCWAYGNERNNTKTITRTLAHELGHFKSWMDGTYEANFNKKTEDIIPIVMEEMRAEENGWIWAKQNWLPSDLFGKDEIYFESAHWNISFRLADGLKKHLPKIKFYELPAKLTKK